MLNMVLMTLKGLILLTGAVFGYAALLRKPDAAWVKKAPFWIFTVMFMIGMWGRNYWVAYAALFLALPLLAKSRADAAALYCVLAVSLPQLATQISVGSLYLIAGSKYLFCALGFAVAFMMKRGSAQGLHRARFALPILIIVVLEMTAARDPSVTATIRQCLPALFTILLPYFLLSRSLENTEDVRRFLLAFVLAGFVMAVVATAEARLHWLIYKQLEGFLDIHVSVNGYSKMRAGTLRAPASFPESTSLGTFLALAFMAALALRDTFASRGRWYVVLFVLTLGLVSANSRGAFIALGVGLMAWDVYCRRYARLGLKMLAAGSLYFFALFAAQFSAFFAAMVGQGSGAAATSDYRRRLFERGMEEIHKHPVLGQNLRAALDNLQDLRQGEGIVDLVNGYISYGLTLGYPGMIGLALVFLSLCAAMWVARRKFRANPALMEPAACVFAVGALNIPNSFFTGFGGTGSTTFYMICGLGGSLWAMRGLAPATQSEAGVPAPQPLSGIAAMIAADRARAKGAPVAQT